MAEARQSLMEPLDYRPPDPPPRRRNRDLSWSGLAYALGFVILLFILALAMAIFGHWG